MIALHWILLLLLIQNPVELLSPSAQDLQNPAVPQPPFRPARNSVSREESSLRRPNRDGSSRSLDDPEGFFTTPRPNRILSPRQNASHGRWMALFPVSGGPYWAYAVLMVSVLVLSVGLGANLCLLCTVWHNAYLKSAWNCVVAGMALSDFLVVTLCLPVRVLHQLTGAWLLGDLACRLVPYLEVTSLGVATFSLCALSIDRFHAATAPDWTTSSGRLQASSVQTSRMQASRLEPCSSILSKLAVIWLGSLLLAAPELLLWRLLQETLPIQPQRQASVSLMAAVTSDSDTSKMEVCVSEAWEELPDSLYSVVLTYQEARAWWMFGCYLCLPLLFTLACDLVTRQVLAQRLPQKVSGAKAGGWCASPSSSSSSSRSMPFARQQTLRSAVLALTVLYVSCNLPESIWNIALAYVPAAALASLPPLTLPTLGLIGRFLLFARCSATPVLLLCVCRSLGQAFLDCCCCCCQECQDTGASASTACSASTAANSTLSSPCSLAPSSGMEVKSLLPAAPCSQTTDSSAAIGTPC